MAQIWDLYLLESGNGGDLTINGQDLAVCNSIETAIYLSMFGGNVEADTVSPRQSGRQDFSYWGNVLFFYANKNIQFNSKTERTLREVPLTSAGGYIIENAVKSDLSFIPGAKISVSIVSTDRIDITLRIILPSGMPKIVTFSLVRNTTAGRIGDFDLRDFDMRDFY